MTARIVAVALGVLLSNSFAFGGLIGRMPTALAEGDPLHRHQSRDFVVGRRR